MVEVDNWKARIPSTRDTKEGARLRTVISDEREEVKETFDQVRSSLRKMKLYSVGT